VNQLYELMPEIKELVSHTLTYEDLTFSEDVCQVYKDINLLAHNRSSHFTKVD